MTCTRKIQTTWETCPISGLRERRSDCVLGRESRKKYDEAIEGALASGEQITDMFVFAETEGRKTLEWLKKRRQEAETEKTNKHNSLFNRAEIQLKANLSSQKNTHFITDGIRRHAKIKIFEKMRDEDKEYQKLSKKAHGLKKAMESLQKYLNSDLPRMCKEAKEKRAAEDKIKISA